MSLPPKLLERLKKRGIIQENEDQSKRACLELSSSTKRPSIVIGCPNKYNIYHDCNGYCDTKYGQGFATPSTKIKRIYEILIENYPLTAEWQSIWEPGCARFYFYNVNTNESSWLPPGHPKFKSTKGIRVLKGVIDSTAESIDQLNNKPSFEQSESDKRIDKELTQFDNELNSELGTLNNELSTSNRDESTNEQLDEQSNEDNDESDECDQESSNSEQSSSEEEN